MPTEGAGEFLAAPLGAHLLGRAIHISLPLQADEIDELADDLADDLAGTESSEPLAEGREP